MKWGGEAAVWRQKIIRKILRINLPQGLVGKKGRERKIMHKTGKRGRACRVEGRNPSRQNSELKILNRGQKGVKGKGQ